jgi:hypothetical protein
LIPVVGMGRISKRELCGGSRFECEEVSNI